MHFDDRLETVLRLRAGGPAVARIQYRQLLDLLGTTAPGERSGNLDSAFVRLAELAEAIPPDERAAMLADRGLRLRSPRLVAQLAAAEPPVAIAALRRASLDEEQWLDLIPALPMAARGFIRHRRDLGRRVEALLERLGVGNRAIGVDPSAVPTAPANDTGLAPDGIGALVRRIEAFRRSRAEAARIEPQSSGGTAPRLPLGDTNEAAQRQAQAFDFATDASGRVTWGDPGVAPMVVGLQLFAREADGIVIAPASLATDFQRRQPVRGAAVAMSGAAAVAGDWRLDASPAFDPIGGRFIGYRGRMRRPAPNASNPTPPTRATRDADRIRQLLHELRTPVTAIQGFAEVIQQQLFEPTPHAYRALAANIVGDSARMLAGFDELDRLARLEGGALALEPGRSDLAAIIAATVARLAAHGESHGTGFSLAHEPAPLEIALAQRDAEQLAWRLLTALAGRSERGELLSLRLDRVADRVRVTVQLPAALAELEGEALFTATAAGTQALAGGMFGTGFALRLASGEARAAGGSLEREGAAMVLALPLASEANEGAYDAANHSVV